MFNQLGVTPTQQVLAKGQLAAWSKSPDGGSSTLTNYGQLPEDFTADWTARDRATLGDFSRWWDSKGQVLSLPVAPSQDLSEAHVFALNTWAAGQLGVPMPVPGLPAGTPFPPAPPGWPASLPWPLIGSEKPVGWPPSWQWPPSAPAGLPASVPWPIPLPQVPGAPTALPGAPETPTGPLPPAPSPAPATKEKKGMSGWWLAAGIAAGVAVLATYWESRDRRG